MNFKTADTDMLHGPLTKKILLFTLPIALSSILQQLFNAADTAVVGYFGNKDALAAVGTNTEIIALIVTVSSGLSVGANILVAGLIGKGRREEIPFAVRTSVVMAVIIGISGMISGQFAAEPLLRLICAALYFQWTTPCACSRAFTATRRCALILPRSRHPA